MNTTKKLINTQTEEDVVKIIGNTYKHNEQKFSVEVMTCNRKIATTKKLETGETVKFNRGKFEWMIDKGVFSLVNKNNEE